MYKGLSDYIDALEREGELVRVKVPVDPVLEISELTDRESKKPGGGKALLFENTGTAFPVITNMMGSDRRIAMALGVERLDELTERIEVLFKKLTSPKHGVLDKLSMLPTLGEVSRWMPRSRKGRGECQQIILKGAAADLSTLPILKCWPHDGGRFVTLPLVNTLDPDSGIRNVGMYRMQVFDKRSTGMHWHLHKTGERHYRRYRELGKRMPVSVCIGGDPAYTYAATAPMPDNMDEYLLAGFIRRRAVELVKCVTNDIMVPADCDFVIEGYVDPAEEKVAEGPFGDHTGFYSLEDKYPLFHVTAITHRRDAVYPATVVGVPPQEDAYIGKATEKIFLAPIRIAMLPEIKDLYMPFEGVAHNLAVVNIKKSFAGQGFRAGNMLWGAGQMMFNKFLVVTAIDADIRDPETLRRFVTGIRIPEDVLLSRGPLDVLDHAAPEMGFGGKMMLDTTGVDLSGEPAASTAPASSAPSSSAPASSAAPSSAAPSSAASAPSAAGGSLAATWRLQIIKCRPGVPAAPAPLPALPPLPGIKFVLLVDEAVDTENLGDLLWLATANTDPVRDVKISNGMLIFDARIKAGGVSGFSRRWPNVVTSSPETIKLVDSRQSEYGIPAPAKSPSLRYIPLNRGDSAYYDDKTE